MFQNVLQLGGLIPGKIAVLIIYRNSIAPVLGIMALNGQPVNGSSKILKKMDTPPLTVKNADASRIRPQVRTYKYYNYI